MSTTHFVIYWKEVSWSPLAKEPGRAAWKHDTDVQNRADVNPTLRDVLERIVVESAGQGTCFVPPGNTTLAYKTVQMSTSHFVMYWKEVSRSPLVWTGAFSRK